MKEKVRQELKKRDATVLTTLHALGDDVNTAFAPDSKTVAFNAVVARTLYRFSQGMKVCVEIVLMAAENGAIDFDLTKKPTQKAIIVLFRISTIKAK